jgi:hypothetical protein
MSEPFKPKPRKLPITWQTINKFVLDNIRLIPNSSNASVYIREDIERFMNEKGVSYENIKLSTTHLQTVYDYLQSKVGTDYFHSAARLGVQLWEERNQWRMEAMYEEGYGEYY